MVIQECYYFNVVGFDHFLYRKKKKKISKKGEML